MKNVYIINFRKFHCNNSIFKFRQNIECISRPLTVVINSVAVYTVSEKVVVETFIRTYAREQSCRLRLPLYEALE